MQLNQSTRRMGVLVAPLLAALLTACAAPVFQQPSVTVPAAFKESAVPLTATDGTRWKVGQPAESQPRGQWWLVFHDTTLDDLIAQAASANASLEVAAARLKQARAVAGIAAADRIPQVGINAGAQRGRTAPGAAGLPADAGAAPTNLFQAGLTASYEVDLFGRVAANVGATRLDAAAASATYRSVLLSLQADVAQTYFHLRQTDAELETLARAIKLREENVHVNQRRYDLGDIGEFDLARAKTELSTARAEAIGVQRQRVTGEHALAVLLGRPAADFSLGAAALQDSTALPVVPAGLPSSLLERRPDIAAAQQTMEASNQRIGVARSAMFPALSLNAAAGGQSGGSIADVLRWSSRSWILGALLSMPLIDGGRNRNNIVRSEAVLEESVATYRQSVLVAFAEVEDNLAGLRILQEQSAQLDDAVGSARRSAQLAQTLYAAGRSSYLDVLDAQRNLATIERAAVQLRGNRAVTTVSLIRALGGGWDSAQPVAMAGSATGSTGSVWAQ